MLVIADAIARAGAGRRDGRRATARCPAARRRSRSRARGSSRASVRRTSKRLGLSTEASYRFERGADFDARLAALARACALIEQIGAGTIRAGWIDACPGAARRLDRALRPGARARMSSAQGRA